MKEKITDIVFWRCGEPLTIKTDADNYYILEIEDGKLVLTKLEQSQTVG